MYTAFGCLTSTSDFTLTEAARRLADKLPSFQIKQEGNSILATSSDWELHLTLNESPEVLDESREMAERIGGAEDAKDLASCARRVELGSDISDPMMEHFNDYLLAVEALRSFNGLIAVDPREPSLL